MSADLVPAHVRNYTVMTQLRCVHGDERSYPTANVQVEVLGQTYLLEVGVVDSLPYQMILGQDFPVLFDLVPVKNECNVTVTRAMAKQKETEMSLAALPWYDSEIEAQPGKTRKSKRQKRQEKFQFGVAHSQEEACPEQFEVPIKIPQDIVCCNNRIQTLAHCTGRLRRKNSSVIMGENRQDMGFHSEMGYCTKGEG